MRLLSSLRSRMFLASAVLAVLCIATAIYIVNGQVTREAERTLEREIIATSAQVDQLRADRAQTFMMMARLIADLPKLKAAVETDDPPTVEDIARGYQSQLNASLVLVTNKRGQVLYAAGGSPRAADIAAHQGSDSLHTGPVALILRSRTAQLQSLQTIHTFLVIAGMVAILLAIGLSFAVARTIARPLAAITDVMREVAATGDLTRKIALRHG